jgi:hypothetical protein
VLKIQISCNVTPYRLVTTVTDVPKDRKPTSSGSGSLTSLRRIRDLEDEANKILPNVSVYDYQSTRCYISYLFTPWSRILLEKLTVNFAASQEIPRIYENRKSLTVPTRARHLSLSRAKSIQFLRPPPTS